MIEKPVKPPTGPAMRNMEQARRAAAEVLARFPGEADEDKMQRAVKAAMYVRSVIPAYSHITAARFALAPLFRVSERQIRRAERIFNHPDMIPLVLKGAISVMTAAHVAEHPGYDVLLCAWTCAPAEARREFLAEIRKAEAAALEEA